MAYKPVQNESAHLTDKPGRSAFGPRGKKHGKKRDKETREMKGAMPYKRSKAGKTDS